MHLPPFWWGCSKDARLVPQEACALVHGISCLLILLSILNSTGLYNKRYSNKPAYIIHKTAQSCSAAYGTDECCFAVGGDRVDRNVLGGRKGDHFTQGISSASPTGGECFGEKLLC